MNESERLLVVQGEVRIRIRGPDAFVMVGPSAAVLGNSFAVRLLSYFNTPVAPSLVCRELAEEVDLPELTEAIASLEHKGLIGVARTTPNDPKYVGSAARCRLAEGIDRLKGDTRVALLRTATQELLVFSGLYASIVEVVPSAGQSPLGVDQILEGLARGHADDTRLEVQLVLADLAEQGLLFWAESSQ